MNIATIIGPLLSGLISKILDNQLTKQNINDHVKDIVDKVQTEIAHKDGVIASLESKLTELANNLDSIVNVKIDALVQQIQEKTPFFIDPIVAEVGEELKKGIDASTDSIVKTIVDFVDAKAKDLGFVDNSAPAPVVTVSNTVPVDETVKTESKDLPFLSDSANQILKDLKN